MNALAHQNMSAASFKCLPSALCFTLIWCLFFTGRMQRSGKLPVLNLITGKNSGFSPLRGDSMQRMIYVKLGRTDRHVGSLGCAKFHLNRQRGGGNAAQNIKKIPLFGKQLVGAFR